jgi:hypothetical protein
MKRMMASMVLTAFILSIAGIVAARQDIEQVPACLHCGMDRTKFAHSRVFVAYDDGTNVGTCSIHCLAIDLAVNIDKTPSAIEVGDFNGKKLIDAEKAFWVIGGNKPGVMSKQAKWAFEKQEDAEKFISENGGSLTNFDEAMKAAYASMYADVQMIREKRKMMKMKMKGAAQQ